MTSIVIPAHNEEAVIGRCLGALLDGAAADELEIVVACNGCTDGTAARARSFGRPVQVVEIDEASKTAALNAADRVATGFPRIYVDADVVLPLGSVRKLVKVLERGDALLASPVADTDTSASSAAVRDFYDIWHRLPYNQVMVGTGVYALSQEGRARFGEFPSIIADDGYVRSRFLPQERVAVHDAPVRVFAPRTYGDLIRVKTRGRVGGYELRAKFPQPGTSDPKAAGAIVKSLPWDVRLPWKAAVYVWANIVVRIGAYRRLRGDGRLVWERDERSRV